MKAVVAAFNQEKALVGAFSVITNLRMEIFEALFLKHIHIKLYKLHWLQTFFICWNGEICGKMYSVE